MFPNENVFNAGRTGCAITIDWARGAYQMCTLTTPAPVITFKHSALRPHGLLELHQDIAGGRIPVITGAEYRSGSAPVWSTAPGTHDTLDIYYNVVTGGLNVFLKT